MEVLKFCGNATAAMFEAGFRYIWSKSKKSIDGEIALVTGAGHGIGQGLALKLASLKAIVIAVDINEPNNQETVNMIRESGGQAYSYICDLSKREEIKSMAKKIKIEVGDVTILVNNAGVNFVTDFMSRTDDMIQTTFNVNILAHFWMIREFLPEMKKKNHGHIVAVSSMAGVLGVPYLADYCSTKHAILGMMDSLRRELRWEQKTGVITTACSPSWVATGFAQNPKSGSHLFCPILTVETVTNEIVNGMLKNEPSVETPSSAPLFFMKAILPDAIVEMLVDIIRPTCDQLQAPK